MLLFSQFISIKPKNILIKFEKPIQNLKTTGFMQLKMPNCQSMCAVSSLLRVKRREILLHLQGVETGVYHSYSLFQTINHGICHQNHGGEDFLFWQVNYVKVEYIRADRESQVSESTIEYQQQETSKHSSTKLIPIQTYLHLF